MIYVLSSFFHCIQDSLAVYISTLIDHLDMFVKYQANLLKDRHIASNSSTFDRINNYTTDKKNEATDKKRKSQDYFIGALW